MTTIHDLKKHAIAASLFQPTTLKHAIAKLGFVQADPIQAPARAQDLILRHRVKGYQVGDLDKGYGRLKLEEDLLYAYGFMPLDTWRLLHPRGERALSSGESEVLGVVQGRKRLHPRELQTNLGANREVNAWGGYSRSTTRCLERLHYLGLIRVAGRENGVKLYRPADRALEPEAGGDRLQQLVLLIARILAPVPESSLRSALQHLRYSAPNLEGRKTVIKALLESGFLDSAIVDGVRWLWPAGRLIRFEAECELRGWIDNKKLAGELEPVTDQNASGWVVLTRKMNSERFIVPFGSGQDILHTAEVYDSRYERLFTSREAATEHIEELRGNDSGEWIG